jgi:hypothetical protein
VIGLVLLLVVVPSVGSGSVAMIELVWVPLEIVVVVYVGWVSIADRQGHQLSISSWKL